MMLVAERDVAALIDEIWLTTLGLATHRVAPETVSLPAQTDTLDGIINITGAWQATVALQVPRRLAERVASVMFQLHDTTPALEDMQDAVGELTNMLGGNIKALLPGECHLSLPAVVEGRGYTVRVPSSHIAERLAFECEGYAAVVTLMSVAPRPS
jgi:CheY-specific phosphatase CheX